MRFFEYTMNQFDLMKSKNQIVVFSVGEKEKKRIFARYVK